MPRRKRLFYVFTVISDKDHIYQDHLILWKIVNKLTVHQHLNIEARHFLTSQWHSNIYFFKKIESRFLPIHHSEKGLLVCIGQGSVR